MNDARATNELPQTVNASRSVVGLHELPKGEVARRQARAMANAVPGTAVATDALVQDDDAVLGVAIGIWFYRTAVVVIADAVLHAELHNRCRP